MRSRLLAFLRCLLVVLACAASGTLECGGRVMNDTQLRGAAVYHRMCFVCHGNDGQGYAADNAPAIANAHFLSMVSDRYLETAIGNGRSGTTMSAWSSMRGGPLGPRELASIVAYLRTYERLPAAMLDDSPAQGDALRGAATFAAQCASCHGDHGTAGPYVHVGNLDLLGSTGNGMLRATIRDGRPGTLMGAFGGKLSAGEIEDVIAALRQWQAQTTVVHQPPAKAPPLPLGPVPLNPGGPEPVGFKTQPATTPVDTVKHELDRGAKMAILDARASSDYMGEHIKGAVSVPFYDVDPYADKLPKDAWLVCYCACPHAESGNLARALVAKGFTKVTVLDEGLGVWRSRKYPTSTGIDP
jgi:cytochrome c oxidase cbb3-type subunit 3/ubiquinol-cytochrome c reductase cytochrome c subunit